MARFLEHQKILRRKKGLSLPSPGKKRGERLKQVRTILSLSGIPEKVKRFLRHLVRSYRKMSFLFATIGFIGLTVMFLTLTVPTSGLASRKQTLSMPHGQELDDLLISYVTPDSGRADEEIRIPDKEVLSSVRSKSYVIKSGDTASEIANSFGLSLDSVLSFNNIRDVRKLAIGMELQLPNMNGVLYTVKRGDSLSVIAQQYGIELNDLLDANNLETSVIRVGQNLFIPGGRMNEFDLKKATGELFLYPCRGYLSSGFGIRKDPFTGVNRMHYGIDLANSEGVDVKAAMDGTVVALGFNQKGYGRYVIIKHAAGFQTLYAHLLKWTVSEGEKVSQGEKIGELGNTGRSTGPHLHFSIYRYQQPVDPLKYLF